MNISDLYQREFNYGISIALAKTLKDKRLLIDKEYDKIIHHFVQKHDPPTSTLRQNYFNDYIQRDPEYEFAGVYADEAYTGTKDDRPEFQRMLNDCRAGKIDFILCKSITRFARNTVTLLETVRELKALEIGVYFENERINTLSGDGELMLTILASFAQAESLSVSENCKWRIRNDFKKGKISNLNIYGYRRNDEGRLVIEPDEAEIVRMIFREYIRGIGRQAIANNLNDMNIPTRYGTIWHHNSVGAILRNEKYTGNMVLQKTFVSDHLTKQKMYNIGQLPMYLIENSHEPIIDRETFDAVQAEIKRRSAINPSKTIPKYPFTSMIICGKCGNEFTRAGRVTLDK